MTSTSAINDGPTSLPAKLNWNALFRGDQEMGAYNACVGNNGSPGIYFYADGFADSVELLIDVLTREDRGLLDTLIYPICFSLRHSVELSLKGQIDELWQLAKLRKHRFPEDTEIERLLNQHDIKNLWSFFTSHAVKFDRRYRETISALDPLIRCIADTDPTGQTFRYSYSNEAKKHLTDVSVINVVVLRDQFRIIRDHLETLRGLSQWLWREYSTQSFTNNLSRKDLKDIAGQLPQRGSWCDPSAGIGGIKASVKSAYEIGSKELTEAFEKIQSIRDLGRSIGIRYDIPGLTLEDLYALNDFWKLAWDRDALSDELREEISDVTRSPIVTMDLLQVLQRDVEVMNDTRSSQYQFNLWATEERLAGLLTLLDASLYRFSEEYDHQYERYKKEMVAAFSTSSEHREAEITDIWNRTICCSNFPPLFIRKLKTSGFNNEATEFEKNLFS